MLFEIATDGPGFAVDEDPAHLGETLVLPPWLEPHRADDRAGAAAARDAGAAKRPPSGGAIDDRLTRVPPRLSAADRERPARRRCSCCTDRRRTRHDLLPLGRDARAGAGVLSPRGKVLERGMPRFFRRLAEGVFDRGRSAAPRTGRARGLRRGRRAPLRLRSAARRRRGLLERREHRRRACCCCGPEALGGRRPVPRDGAARAGAVARAHGGTPVLMCERAQRPAGSPPRRPSGSRALLEAAGAARDVSVAARRPRADAERRARSKTLARFAGSRRCQFVTFLTAPGTADSLRSVLRRP